MRITDREINNILIDFQKKSNGERYLFGRDIYSKMFYERETVIKIFRFFHTRLSEILSKDFIYNIEVNGYILTTVFKCKINNESLLYSIMAERFYDTTLLETYNIDRTVVKNNEKNYRRVLTPLYNEEREIKYSIENMARHNILRRQVFDLIIEDNIFRNMLKDLENNNKIYEDCENYEEYIEFLEMNYGV